MNRSKEEYQPTKSEYLFFIIICIIIIGIPVLFIKAYNDTIDIKIQNYIKQETESGLIGFNSFGIIQSVDFREGGFRGKDLYVIKTEDNKEHLVFQNDIIGLDQLPKPGQELMYDISLYGSTKRTKYKLN